MVNMLNSWKQIFLKSSYNVLTVLGITFISQVSGYDKVENGYFMGDTYKTIQSAGMYWCAKQCVLQGQCKSFNFNNKLWKCELNRLPNSPANIHLFAAGVKNWFVGNSSTFSAVISLCFYSFLLCRILFSL